MKTLKQKLAAILILAVLLSSTFLVFQIPGVNADQNLIAQYKLDENTGTTAYDSSGNGNDGTIYGASWTTGKYGSALSFDGSNDYVSLPSDISDAISSTETLTLMAWVNIPSETSGDLILIQIGGDWDKWCLYIDVADDGKPSLSIAGSYSTRLIATTDVRDDEWHLIIGTYDGTTAKIYVDQELENSASKTLYSQSSVSGRIGLTSSGSGDFIGVMDEVNIYNRALSEQEISNLDSNSVEDAINLGLDWLDDMAYLEINSTHAVALEGPTLGFRIHRSDGYWTIFGKKDEWTGVWPNTGDSNLPPSATMIRGGCLDPQGTTDDLGLITGAIDRQRFKYFFDIDEDSDYNDVVLYIEYATMTNTSARVAGKIVGFVDKGLTLSLQLETTEVLSNITLNAQFSTDKEGGWAGRRYTIRPTTKGLADLYAWLGTTEYPWLNNQTYQQVRGINYTDRALKLYRTWYGSGYIIDRFDGMYGATVNVRPYAGTNGIPNYPANPDLIVEPWWLSSGDMDAYIDNNNKTAGWYNYDNLPDSETFRSQNQIARFATVSRDVMADDTEWNNLPFLCSSTEFCYAYRSRTGFNYARNEYIANGLEFDLLNYNDLPFAVPGVDLMLGIGTDAKSIRACHDMYKYGADVPYGLSTLKTEFIDSAEWDGNGIARDSWHGSLIGWPYPAYGTHNTATYANALIQYYKLTDDENYGAIADEVAGVILMLQNLPGTARFSRNRDSTIYRAEYVGSFLPGYAVAYSFGQQDIYSNSIIDTVYGFLNTTGIFREDPQATAYPVIGNTECTLPSVWALIEYRTTDRTPTSPAETDYSLTFQSNAVAYTDHGGSLGGDGISEIVSDNMQSTYIGGETGNLYQHTGELNRVRMRAHGDNLLGSGWSSIEYQWNLSLTDSIPNWRAKAYFTIPDYMAYKQFFASNSLTVTASLYNSSGQLISQDSRNAMNDLTETTGGTNGIKGKMFVYDNLTKIDSLPAGNYTVKLKLYCQASGSSYMGLGYQCDQAVLDGRWTTFAGGLIDGLPMGLEHFGYSYDKCFLTISSTTGGSTTPNNGTYQYTDTVQVTANPDSGYSFHHWTLDGNNAGSDNPITVQMNNNHTLVAIFVQDISLSPTDDSMVFSYHPDTNYGTDISCDIGYDSGYRISFIDFNLSEVQSLLQNGYIIESASIVLHGDLYIYYPPTDIQINAYLITDNWSETTITYNNQPSYNSTIAGSVNMPGAPIHDITAIIDVTQSLNEVLASETQFYGFRLYGSNDDQMLFWHTKEEPYPEYYPHPEFIIKVSHY